MVSCSRSVTGHKRRIEVSNRDLSERKSRSLNLHTYRILYSLKSADPKLRKAIIANCVQETLKSICECALNFLRGNIPLTACSKRILKKYMNSIRKVADKRISLGQTKGYRSE